MANYKEIQKGVLTEEQKQAIKSLMSIADFACSKGVFDSCSQAAQVAHLQQKLIPLI